MKEKIHNLCKTIDNKCLEQFGFNIRNVTFVKIIDYMYTPKDASSLAVTRILFGFAMLLDIPDERGGANMMKRWGDPLTCHFPLIPILQPIPMPYMALVYAALWFGALGIMLGYKYTVTAPMFTICYWYLFLIEKSFWNNHSYLFGLVALLFSCTQANCYWSLDSYLDPSIKNQTVPYWNYFVLKYQFFILYFMAGMKKGTAEWLSGYSVQNLSEHWVFDPFKYFLTVSQTDYLVVHWFVFLFDLTVAVWMMWSSTRHVAMCFCALFHLMNSRLFRIGMFPWVCLATMPLFYPFDWPKRILVFINTNYNYLTTKINALKNKYILSYIIYNESNEEKGVDDHNKEKINALSEENKMNVVTNSVNKLVEEDEMMGSKEDAEINQIHNKPDEDTTENNSPDKYLSYSNNNSNKKKTIYLIAFYMFMQAFLPYSHFITKGYNNWTNGLYGYSWDMMVHTWDSNTITVKIVDNESKEEMYIDPALYILNDRWSRHGDMIHQYARCLKKNIEMKVKEINYNNPTPYLLSNISIHIDVWCGMNGRFIQRMFDPKIDMLQAVWSPFSKVSYLMPLLDEAIHRRKDLDEIKNGVHSWSNYSDVVFIADFPGYEQEKYIPWELRNVTLKIIQGTVIYAPEIDSNHIGKSFKLSTNESIEVKSGILHKVLNIGDTPSYYMYTFFNGTEQNSARITLKGNDTKLPILRELYRRWKGMMAFTNLVISNIFQLFTCSNC